MWDYLFARDENAAARADRLIIDPLGGIFRCKRYMIIPFLSATVH